MNVAASIKSAVGVPAIATTTPAISGTIASVPVNAKLNAALTERCATSTSCSRSSSPLAPPGASPRSACSGRAGIEEASISSAATCAPVARSKALAASAAVPSIATRRSRPGSQKCHSSAASASAVRASTMYSRLRAPRPPNSSVEATSAGASSAGSPRAATNIPATASALWV